MKIGSIRPVTAIETIDLIKQEKNFDDYVGYEGYAVGLEPLYVQGGVGNVAIPDQYGTKQTCILFQAIVPLPISAAKLFASDALITPDGANNKIMDSMPEPPRITVLIKREYLQDHWEQFVPPTNVETGDA